MKNMLRKTFAILFVLMSVIPAAVAAPENAPAVGSFTGIIEAINPFENGDWENTAWLITLKDENDGQASFIVHESTYHATEIELEMGKPLTGYFDAGVPMTRIYPPQYTAVAVAVLPEGTFIKVDRFDEHFLSSDGELQLNIDANTPIVDQHNMPYEGGVADQLLVVYYNMTTMSIPAQTSPVKIVVLTAGDRDTAAVILIEVN